MNVSIVDAEVVLDRCYILQFRFIFLYNNFTINLVKKMPFPAVYEYKLIEKLCSPYCKWVSFDKIKLRTLKTNLWFIKCYVIPTISIVIFEQNPSQWSTNLMSLVQPICLYILCHSTYYNRKITAVCQLSITSFHPVANPHIHTGFIPTF